ncbi:MAG: DNA repair protein RecN [Planctomycetes bacterium]|nr:DNA repair protein RecN [Planctomycetota bacterium]
MLIELNIQGLAVVESARIAWGEGLNAVTGPTGAGKSLLARSIQVLLGGRIQPDWIRAGAKEAWIEGVFAVPRDVRGARVREAVQEILGGVPEDGLLALTRVLDAGGRSRSYVNNRFVSREGVAAIAGLLIDVHGQRENQSLLRAGVQLELLDAFAGVRDERQAVAAERTELLARERDIERDRAALRAQRDREDLCRFHLQEIRELAPRPGERESLREERALRLHRERITECVGAALDRLQEGEGDMLSELGRIQRSLEGLAQVRGKLDGALDHIEQARLHLEEAVPALRDLLEDGGREGASLEEIESRLAQLERLMARHDRDEAGLLELASELELELDGAANAEEELPKRCADLERRRAALLARARELRAKRCEAAHGLAAAVLEPLRELGLPEAHFEVVVLPLDPERPDEVGPQGLDRVEFRFAANPGEPARALSEVASGGEMARTMLALKGVLSEVDAYPTLFFDEIDAEIGARLGRVVGERLERAAAEHQVICITHLPVVAAAAQHHFRVSKVVRDGRTFSQIDLLEGAARVEELAEMIAGDAVDEAARTQAREMLRLYREGAPREAAPRAKAKRASRATREGAAEKGAEKARS